MHSKVILASMARAVVFFIRKAKHVQQISLLTPTEANSGVYQKSDSIMLPEMFGFFFSSVLSLHALPLSRESVYFLSLVLYCKGDYTSHTNFLDEGN